MTEAEIYNLLYDYYLKYESKKYDEAKVMLETKPIIEMRVVQEGRYIDFEEVNLDIEEGIMIDDLISKLSVYNSTQDYPRTPISWWIYTNDGEGAFPQPESKIVVGYNKLSLVSFSKAQSLAKNWANHDMWDIKHGRNKRVEILQKIGLTVDDVDPIFGLREVVDSLNESNKSSGPKIG